MTNEELRSLRARLGHTQRRLAAALGVQPMTVCRWETGWHPIPPLGATAVRLHAQRHGEPAASRATSAAGSSRRSGGRRPRQMPRRRRAG